jgi:hypothetical protein
MSLASVPSSSSMRCEIWRERARRSSSDISTAAKTRNCAVRSRRSSSVMYCESSSARAGSSIESRRRGSLARGPLKPGISRGATAASALHTAVASSRRRARASPDERSFWNRSWKGPRRCSSTSSRLPVVGSVSPRVRASWLRSESSCTERTRSSTRMSSSAAPPASSARARQSSTAARVSSACTCAPASSGAASSTRFCASRSRTWLARASGASAAAGSPAATCAAPSRIQALASARRRSGSVRLDRRRASAREGASAARGSAPASSANSARRSGRSFSSGRSTCRSSSRRSARGPSPSRRARAMNRSSAVDAPSRTAAAGWRTPRVNGTRSRAPAPPEGSSASARPYPRASSAARTASRGAFGPANACCTRSTTRARAAGRSANNVAARSSSGVGSASIRRSSAAVAAAPVEAREHRERELAQARLRVEPRGALERALARVAGRVGMQSRIAQELDQRAAHLGVRIGEVLRRGPDQVGAARLAHQRRARAPAEERRRVEALERGARRGFAQLRQLAPGGLGRRPVRGRQAREQVRDVAIAARGDGQQEGDQHPLILAARRPRREPVPGDTRAPCATGPPGGPPRRGCRAARAPRRVAGRARNRPGAAVGQGALGQLVGHAAGPGLEEVELGGLDRGRRAALRGASTRTRSSAFSSSRRLPGQACAVRRSRRAGDSLRRASPGGWTGRR